MVDVDQILAQIPVFVYVLIAVVVLPLFIPPVVFGAGALERAGSGQPVGPALALLCAYVLFAAVVAPFAGAAAVRNAQG